MTGTIGQQEGASSSVTELLVRIGDGEQSVFASVYDQLAGKVYGLVRAVVRDPAQAEEVAQEVFVELWQTAPRFSPDKGSATSWAMAVAHRRAIDRVRSAEASARREREATFEAGKNRSFDQVMEAVLDGEEHLQVRECLDRLSELQREAIGLAYYDGRTCHEIARATETSPNTVKSRLRAALRKLRDCMQITEPTGRT